MKYLVFLGNPGKEYEYTRHNAGFLIGERLAARGNWEWRKKNNYAAAGANHAGYLLIKPRTFMNLSGEIFHWLPDFARADLLIVVDDLALPFGKLRLRDSGSAGGHNGLKSIAAALGDNQFARMRFGVGDGEAIDGARMIGQALGNFTPREREQLPVLLDRAADACLDWLEHGVKFCQDRYN